MPLPRLSSQRRLFPLILCLAVWPAHLPGQAPETNTQQPSATVDSKLLLIGSLASSHVYTTFGYIGVVADNAQKGLYKPDQVESLMQEVTLISDPLVSQLELLRQSDLTPVDAKAVTEIIEIYGLLKKEAEALRLYSQTRTEANGSEFNRLHGSTRVHVFQLLGIPLETPPSKSP